MLGSATDRCAIDPPESLQCASADCVGLLPATIAVVCWRAWQYLTFTLTVVGHQKRTLLHDEAVRENAKVRVNACKACRARNPAGHVQGYSDTQIVDVFLCADRLHEMDHVTLRKVLQRGSVLTLPRINGATALKCNLVLLLQRLPCHAMACILARQPLPAAQGTAPSSPTAAVCRLPVRSAPDSSGCLQAAGRRS